jgi:hypothetical protein
MQELPVQLVVLMSTFGIKILRVRRQALIPFLITDDEFENNILICSQLVSPGLLGADSLCAYIFSIDLGATCVARNMPGEELRIIKYPFLQNYEPFKSGEMGTLTEGNDDEEDCIQKVPCNGKVLL